MFVHLLVSFLLFVDTASNPFIKLVKEKTIAFALNMNLLINLNCSSLLNEDKQRICKASSCFAKVNFPFTFLKSNHRLRKQTNIYRETDMEARLTPHRDLS